MAWLLGLKARIRRVREHGACRLQIIRLNNLHCCWLQAAKAPKHSLERHVLVAAFAVAPYSAAKKTRKSMYALHGETFEAVMPQKHVRYLAEQV